MTGLPSLADLASESYVSLTTYRRNGEGVATAVWVAGEGDALTVTTVDGTGKVKRLDRDPHVTLRPCNRMGKVEDGAPTVEAQAEVVRDSARAARLVEPIRRKYGVQYRLIMGIERVQKAFGRPSARIALRITAPE